MSNNIIVTTAIEPTLLDQANPIIPRSYITAIEPIVTESKEFLDIAKKVKIIDEQSHFEAAKIKKTLTTFLVNAKDRRLSITKKARDIVTALNDLAEKALAPALEAKELIVKEIIDYEIKLEHARQVEALRIALINQVFITGKVKETIELNFEMIEKIEAYFKTLAPKDQANPEIAQACHSLLQRVNIEISNLKEREAQKIEQARLAELKAINDTQAVELAKKMAEQAELQRKIFAENQKLEDVRIAQNLEQEKLKAQAVKLIMPTTGIRAYTKFEIIDASLVPRQYCSPDQTLINQALKLGIKEIAGLRIFTEKH
jgi:hypothetical protein